MSAAGFIPPEIWRKTNGRCWYCGCDLSAENWSVDHVLPPVLGGSDLPTNLVPACRPCNSAKGQSASLEGLHEYLIDVAVKRRRPVRVAAVGAPAIRRSPSGSHPVWEVPPGPLLTLKFYFEELGLAP